METQLPPFLFSRCQACGCRFWAERLAPTAAPQTERRPHACNFLLWTGDVGAGMAHWSSCCLRPCSWRLFAPLPRWLGRSTPPRREDRPRWTTPPINHAHQATDLRPAAVLLVGSPGIPALPLKLSGTRIPIEALRFQAPTSRTMNTGSPSTDK